MRFYEVRRIIYDLRPMALDDLGLIPTLKKYLSTIDEYEKDAEIHFQNNGTEQRFHTDFEVCSLSDLCRNPCQMH